MARVAFINLSQYLSCWPGIDGAIVPADERKALRQNTKGNTITRARCVYTYSVKAQRFCRLCFLPGCWNVAQDDPARLEMGHIIPLSQYGAWNAVNIVPVHAECNAAAGDRDLRGWIERPSIAWNSEAATRRWIGSPSYYVVHSDLPTIQEMSDARAERGMLF